MKTTRRFATLAVVALACLALDDRQPSWAYVEVPYTLGRVMAEATNIILLQIEKVDKEKNLIIFKKVRDLKGTYPHEVIKHNIGRGGFHPREWQFIMEGAIPGKMAVFFHNNASSETCIEKYWYQAYPGGEWWNMSHAEPYMLRSFCGQPDKLATAITAMLANQEVVVPCMEDGNKEALQLRTAKIQRLKASQKIMDYDPKRDFVGWGGEDFRALAGMPGFTHYAGLNRVDPGAAGVSAADFDGDKKPDLCVFGEGKVSLLQLNGMSLNEVALPYTGGARAAAWADYNADGKPDLALATPAGPKLFTNEGGKFRDDSAGLPSEPYYNVSSAAWIDYDRDNHPDLLVANGFLGLRLYRNRGPNAAAAAQGAPKLGKWHTSGPFPGAFDAVNPPEQELDLAKTYAGKSGEQAVWQPREFADGQVHSLAIFKPEHNADASVYLWREIVCGGPFELPISLGSDDGLVVWLNGVKLHSENVGRGAAPDQAKLVLKLKPGKNNLLLKIVQGSGDWAFYFKAAEPTRSVPPLFEDVSAQAGLGLEGLGGQQKGDHLAVADVNGDGFQDFLYSAGTGLLALGSPKGFVEAKTAGIRFQSGRVAPLFGDFDGDKHIDLFVPQRGVCKLFKNDGRGQFTDVTAKSGDLARPIGDATCAVWATVGKEKLPSLYVGCLKGLNRSYRNRGDGTFLDTSPELGLEQRIFNTRGIGMLDLNADGALDAVFSNEGQESSVLLGRVPTVLAAKAAAQ